MGKKFFLKGLFAAILSITIATIFGNSASYAEAVITRGLFTGEGDVRWEWQKTIDADNEAEPESVSIMFYDKPTAATTIVVPSLSDVITAASASQSLDTYYVRNADQTSQDEYFTSETRRESTADVTVLDMTNTSKVQIMGVKPILNPETEAELIFGENMVIGDEFSLGVRVTFREYDNNNYYTSWCSGSGDERVCRLYLENYSNTTITTPGDYIENYSQMSLEEQINYAYDDYSLYGCTYYDGGAISSREFDPSKRYCSDMGVKISFSAGADKIIRKRVTADYCSETEVRPDRWNNPNRYCTAVEERVIEDVTTVMPEYYLEKYQRLSFEEQRSYEVTVSDLGCRAIGEEGLYSSNTADCYTPADGKIIVENIESIDTGAFAGYKLKLTNFENVKYIGWYAFQHTTLNEESRHITIGANQTAGEGVFAWSNVTGVTFEGTKTFPSMFRDCPDLSEIHLNNVEIISYETFMNTNLGSMDFSGSKVKTILGSAFRNAGLASINLEGVQSIGGEAFMDNDLTSLVLPKSIIDLNEARIFAGNKNLTELTVAYDTMMMDHPLHNVIGEWVGESDAVVHKIKKLTLIAPYAEDEAVGEKHHTYAEILNSGRTSSGYMWSIGEDLNSDVENYKNIIAPSYFAWFTSLEDITIGDGYEFVGVNAFYNYLYKPFQISPAQYYYEYLADDADRAGFNERKYYVSLPESLKGIGANSFALHPEGDFSINLPEALEYIGPHAFENDAYMMNDIDLPNLKYLGFQAFFVTGIHNVYLHDKLEYVGGTPFMSCWNINDVTFDYDVFGINNGAILSAGTWGAAMLGHVIVTYDVMNDYGSDIARSHYGDRIVRASVNWDQHVLKRGNITFTEKAVTEPNTTPNWLYMTATKTVDLSKTPWKTVPPRAFNGASIEKLLLPEHLETIGESAFDSSRVQSELVLPDSIKTIGANAFNNWQNSTSTGAQYDDEARKYVYYYIDEQDNLYKDGEFIEKSTGGKTASHALGVTITKLPSSLEYIGYAAFFGDRNLTADLNAPNLKTIQAVAFMGTQLRNVTLNNALESMDPYVFVGIPTLETVLVDCDYLAVAHGYGNMLTNFNARLSFVNELANITDGVMAKEIIFTERATTAPTTAGFLYGAKAETVDLSLTSWTELPRDSFNNAKVQTVKLPQGTTNIVDDTFFRAQAPDDAEDPYTTVVVPSTIITLGREAFEFAKIKLEGFGDNQAFADGLTAIGDAAFYGAEVYGDMVIPESVQAIGLSAFNAGDADTHYDTVTIKAPLDYAKTSNQAVFQMFWNAEMDKLVVESPMLPVLGTLQDEPVLPADIEVDGEMVSPLRTDGEPEFHGMTMKEVEIKNLPVITANAFEECGNLEKVSFTDHDSLTSIERYAFNNDTKLKTFVFGDGLVGKDVKLGTFAFNNTAIETIGDKNTDFALTAANFDASETLVFANLPALKSVYVPGTLTIQSDAANAELFTNGSTIPAYTFAYDPELEEVILDYQISRVDDGAFIDDNKLAKLFVWGNTQISESDEFVVATNNLTIPAGTTIFAYSDAPAEQYANAESRDAYDGKFYALDEVLYLTTNRNYVVLNEDKDDFDKSDLKLYALRRDGVILESDNWQEYTTAFPRSIANINFEEGRGALGSDEADIAGIVYDAPKPFDAISLANQNYANVDFTFLQMPSSTNPLVLINYPDGYTGNIRTATLASMTKEEEEEYLRRLEEELEVPNTGSFLNVIKTATPVFSIVAIVVAGGLFIAKKRKN